MDAVFFDSVVKAFGRVVAVDGVTLSVPEGAAVALVGPNGAGKTTLLKLAAGVLAPDKGEVYIYGTPARRPQSKRRVGFTTPMDRGIYWRLNAVDNLLFFGALYGLSLSEAKRRALELLDELGLRDRAYDLVAGYSTGMMRRLELARSLMHDPDVLLLDEPTSGMDVDAKRAVLEYLKRLKGEKTLIVASHDPQEIALADSVVYINKRVLAEAPSLKVVKLLVRGEPPRDGVVVEKIGEDEYVVTLDVRQLGEYVARLNGAKIVDVEVEVAVAERNARRAERVARRDHGPL
ncbi:MAG: ABC transporter ATP-binding protein [Thermoproteus sp.]